VDVFLSDEVEGESFLRVVPRIWCAIDVEVGTEAVECLVETIDECPLVDLLEADCSLG
jgi:hypothetical protein